MNRDSKLKAVFGRDTDPISEVEKRAIREFGPDAIVWEGDAQTFAFSFVGAAAEKALGHRRGRWTEEATFWADHVVAPEDREEAIAYCALATAKKRDHVFEYRARTRDGGTLWLRDYVKVIVGAKGIPVKLRGVMIDVSAEKQGAATAPLFSPAREELLKTG